MSNECKKLVRRREEEQIRAQKEQKRFKQLIRAGGVIVILLLLCLIWRCSAGSYTLELVGDNPQIITKGDNYVEQGYRFVDEDGKEVSKAKHEKLSKDVLIKGVSSVNTNKTDDYKVEYHYKDQVNIRIVRVVDKEEATKSKANKDNKKDKKDKDDESSDDDSDSDSKEKDAKKKETEKSKTDNNYTNTGVTDNTNSNWSTNGGNTVGGNTVGSNTVGGNTIPGGSTPPSGNVTPGENNSGNQNSNNTNPSNPDNTKPVNPSKPDSNKLLEYDMTGVSFNDKTVVWDGKQHSIFVSGNLPAGLKASYWGNARSDAGEYEVTVTFTGDSNHKAVRPMKAKLTILKATYDQSKYVFRDATFKYDGKKHSIYVDESSLDKGVTVYRYEGNGVSKVGTHWVTAYLKGDTKNHNALKPIKAKIVITADDSGNQGGNQGGTEDPNPPTPSTPYDVTQALQTFVGKEVTFDESVHSITVNESILPAGVSVSYTYNGNTATGAKDAGTYEVIAHFSGNVTQKTSAPVILKINKANRIYNMSVSFPTGNDAVKNYTGSAISLPIVGTLPEGVEVDYYTYNDDVCNGVVGSSTVDTTYTVTAYFRVSNSNYNPPAPISGTLTIKATGTDPNPPTPPVGKQEYDLSGITMPTQTFTYEEGTSRSISYVGTLPNPDIQVQYFGNGVSDASDTAYEVKAVFTYPETETHKAVYEERTGYIIINRKNYDMTGVAFPSVENNVFNMTGAPHSIQLASTGSLPLGEVSITYSGNGIVGDPTKTTDYTVVANFSTSNLNYNAPAPVYGTMRIVVDATEVTGPTTGPTTEQPQPGSNGNETGSGQLGEDQKQPGGTGTETDTKNQPGGDQKQPGTTGTETPVNEAMATEFFEEKKEELFVNFDAVTLLSNDDEEEGTE